MVGSVSGICICILFAKMCQNQVYYDEHKELSQILLTMTQLGFPSTLPYSMRHLIDRIKVVQDRLTVLESRGCIHTMTSKSVGHVEGYFMCTKCEHTKCCG